MAGRPNSSCILVCPLDCIKPDYSYFDAQLYKGFKSDDIDTRENTYKYLHQTLSSCLDGIDSPQHYRRVNGTHSPHTTNGDNEIPAHNGTSSRTISPQIMSMLKYHQSLLSRLSVRCPTEDVRAHCLSLLELLKEGGVEMNVPVDVTKGPSSFIPESEVVPVTTQLEKTKVLFTEAYRQNSRLDHLTQIMGFHPQYLACFLRTQNRLMRAEGPLPFTHRHYIAILAAARHSCTYLVHLHTAEYLQAGGDRSWLESLDNVPQKLRNLQEINRLLAHRPWMVTSKNIENLCRCGRDSWSMSELTHAIVLMAHFHSMCSAVFGCGVNFELDDSAGIFLHSDGESNSDSDNDSIASEQAAVDSLLDRLKKLKDDAEEYSEEEGKRRFETIESQTADYPVQGQTKTSSATGSCITRTTTSNMSHLVDSPEFAYADFIKFKDTTQTFRASDYSWESHGYSIANRFYSDIGELLDEKFTVAKEFTYYTIGEKYTDVNTQDFRTGIWNYIHCIMGIRHDDYDYGRINSLLERGLKSFIKLMTCYPEKVSKKDFDGVMKGFTYSEKIHVNIILLEARMQAELLYALRAVTQFMT